MFIRYYCIKLAHFMGRFLFKLFFKNLFYIQDKNRVECPFNDSLKQYTLKS